MSVLQGFIKAASLSWFCSFNDIVSRSWLKGSLSQIQRYSNIQLSFQSWLYVRKYLISRQQRRPSYIGSCLAYQRGHLSDNSYSLILPCSYSHDHLSLVTTVTFGKWVWPRYFYIDTGKHLSFFSLPVYLSGLVFDTEWGIILSNSVSDMVCKQPRERQVMCDLLQHCPWHLDYTQRWW